MRDTPAPREPPRGAHRPRAVRRSPPRGTSLARNNREVSSFSPLADALRQRLDFEYGTGTDHVKRPLTWPGKRQVLRFPQHELLAAPDRRNHAEHIALRTEDLDADVGRDVHAAVVVHGETVGAVVLGKQRVLAVLLREALVLREVAAVGQRA